MTRLNTLLIPLLLALGLAGTAVADDADEILGDVPAASARYDGVTLADHAFPEPAPSAGERATGRMPA